MHILYLQHWKSIRRLRHKQCMHSHHLNVQKISVPQTLHALLQESKQMRFNVSTIHCNQKKTAHIRSVAPKSPEISKSSSGEKQQEIDCGLMMFFTKLLSSIIIIRNNQSLEMKNGWPCTKLRNDPNLESFTANLADAGLTSFSPQRCLMYSSITLVFPVL